MRLRAFAVPGAITLLALAVARLSCPGEPGAPPAARAVPTMTIDLHLIDTVSPFILGRHR